MGHMRQGTPGRVHITIGVDIVVWNPCRRGGTRRGEQRRWDHTSVHATYGIKRTRAAGPGQGGRKGVNKGGAESGGETQVRASCAMRCPWVKMSQTIPYTRPPTACSTIRELVDAGMAGGPTVSDGGGVPSTLPPRPRPLAYRVEDRVVMRRWQRSREIVPYKQMGDEEEG